MAGPSGAAAADGLAGWQLLAAGPAGTALVDPFWLATASAAAAGSPPSRGRATVLGELKASSKARPLSLLFAAPPLPGPVNATPPVPR